MWWIMWDTFSFAGIVVVCWVFWQSGALFKILGTGDNFALGEDLNRHVLDVNPECNTNLDSFEKNK